MNAAVAIPAQIVVFLRRLVSQWPFHSRSHSSSPPPSPAADAIHRLIRNPILYDPVRAPRYPLVLCHGLYGFDVRGPASFPFLRLHYWAHVLRILRHTVGADVIVTAVPGTGSIAARAAAMDAQLQRAALGRGVNLLAHSMGGLDCRHLISHIRPSAYVPLSLTTICTPHRGSAFMDWCAQNIGIGKLRHEHAPSPAALPSSFTTLLLSPLDSPAYADLTSAFLTRSFNPRTPDVPGVRYFSVAARTRPLPVWHPLWLPKTILDGADDPQSPDDPLAGNDGLVSVRSAHWGEFLGVLEGCDHWEMRGARGLELGDPAADTGDGWGVRDWGRFVGAWRREESAARVAVAHKGVLKTEERRMERQRADDAALKSSTDKLSAVFDWIVDQPTRLLASADKEKPQPKKPRVHELATKKDLERFYVALTRKLYDEGL